MINVIEGLTPIFAFSLIVFVSGPTKKMAIQSRVELRGELRGESRQIAANRGKLDSKNNGVTFLINRDGSHRRGPSKKQWRPLCR